MFKKVDWGYSFPQMEERILKFWEEEKIFEESLKKPAPRGNWIFYEGPPTANGLPHPGHLLTRVVKDLFPRYKTMKGWHVDRKAGWDTHGLPVEIEVEKELGLESKDDIERMGIAAFVKLCKESVLRYQQEWERITKRIGFWIDTENAYWTFTPEYIETVWWELRKFWDAGLLYEGYKILPYCPRCGTALSNHEVAQGYKETTDPSVYVKFPVRNQPGTYFLVWTTTPWTLISNVALTVRSDYKYVKVSLDGEFLILAEALLSSAGLEDSPVVERFSGKELAGIEYEPLFKFQSSSKPHFFVILGEFVTLTEGTGIVHTAPGFGEEDYAIGLRYDLPVFNPVDERGRFKEEIETWAGQFVKDADPSITDDLKRRGLLFRAAKHVHQYPFCWRCDTPLIYYSKSSWFIKTTAYREKLIESNQKINWYPENIKSGRFGKYLEQNIDWALSRQRYWGTPLNIWKCETCRLQECVGSFEELRSLARNFPESFEPHRPEIDEMILTCKECGGDMRRLPDVIDCWFDAGSMPLAQYHWPFSKEKEFDDFFPADFIAESIDQTRGWFYTLLVISTFLFGKSPYKNCLVLGHIQDEQGLKMSKKNRNFLDPWEILNEQGADAFRWYFLSNSTPWNPNRFFPRAVMEAQKQFLIMLQNIYSFFVIYANIDKFKPSGRPVALKKRRSLDRFIISRFNTLVRTVTESLDGYNIGSAARAVQEFVEVLSNWYIRRSRPVFWQSESNVEKESAYQTLYYILIEFSKLIAPIVPFIAEEIYQNLVWSLDEKTRRAVFGKKAEKSVHLCDYPEWDAKQEEKTLEKEMNQVLGVVNVGRAARGKAKIKLRQPLKAVTIVTKGKEYRAALKKHEPLVKEELNVKEIKWTEESEELVSYKMRLLYPKLGPRLGGMLPKVQEFINTADISALIAEMKKRGSFKVEFDGDQVEINSDEVEVNVKEREGTVAESYGDLLLVLETTLTPELVREGLAAEVINRIQNRRKALDLDYQERIGVRFWTDAELAKAIDDWSGHIKDETLATELESVSNPDELDGGIVEEEVDSHPFHFTLITASPSS